jgi:septal ring factor EnvC (AmiA/AmiB activator)
MALKAEKQEMARRRAMLTDTERELLESDEKTDRYYQAVSRVRRKINEELSTDIEILEENHPELLEELKEVVCEEE